MRSRKNNIVPMRLARRILPFAACVVIVCGGACSSADPAENSAKPAKAGRRKTGGRGVYAPQEVASAEKLTGCGGLSGQGYCFAERKSNGSFLCDIWGWLAEITYRWDSQSICFRQSQGQEDNSGDYTHYAEEKLIVVGKYSVTFKGQEKGSYMLATWSDGTYSFSVSATQALKKAEFLGLIEEIEKNI